MLDAFERFTNQNPESSLKLLKIVIFQQSMMDSFKKQALKKANEKKWSIKRIVSVVKSGYATVKSTFDRALGQSMLMHI